MARASRCPVEENMFLVHERFETPNHPQTAPIPNFAEKICLAPKALANSHWIPSMRHTKPHWIPLSPPNFHDFPRVRPNSSNSRLISGKQGKRGFHAISQGEPVSRHDGRLGGREGGSEIGGYLQENTSFLTELYQNVDIKSTSCVHEPVVGQPLDSLSAGSSNFLFSLLLENSVEGKNIPKIVVGAPPLPPMMLGELSVHALWSPLEEMGTYQTNPSFWGLQKRSWRARSGAPPPTLHDTSPLDEHCMILADWNWSSTELKSGSALGAFLQTRAPVPDKISGPVGARFLSSTGLGFGNLIERAQFFPVPALDKNRSPRYVLPPRLPLLKKPTQILTPSWKTPRAGCKALGCDLPMGLQDRESQTN